MMGVINIIGIPAEIMENHNFTEMRALKEHIAKLDTLLWDFWGTYNLDKEHYQQYIEGAKESIRQFLGEGAALEVLIDDAKGTLEKLQEELARLAKRQEDEQR